MTVTSDIDVSGKSQRGQGPANEGESGSYNVVMRGGERGELIERERPDRARPGPVTELDVDSSTFICTAAVWPWPLRLAPSSHRGISTFTYRYSSLPFGPIITSQWLY
ncbi:hypothetical protein J6590_002446 [Homalodisca vitripennis]|nr:hypothetical protein J6590_002446 [Homalodisca vitripennis]